MNSSRPRITIVTPCFNSEATIEDTLRSIYNQNYCNLEHIVMDGGSTDGTLTILDKYKDKIAKLVSKKDAGQYHAINEGFSYATGDIYCWLNADDISMPWTLETIAEIFTQFKEVHWIAGTSAFTNKRGLLKRIYNNISAKDQTAIQCGWYTKNGYGYLQQESMFWTKELWGKVNGLDCRYKMAADFDLWVRFANHAILYSLDIPLSAFRIHNNSRSVIQADLYTSEVKQIRAKLKPLPLRYRLFGKYRILNFLLRLLTLKKTMIIIQGMASDSWTMHKRRRPLSGINFMSLRLENSVRRLDKKK